MTYYAIYDKVNDEKKDTFFITQDTDDGFVDMELSAYIDSVCDDMDKMYNGGNGNRFKKFLVRMNESDIERSYPYVLRKVSEDMKNQNGAWVKALREFKKSIQ